MITAEEQKAIQDAESIYRMVHGGGWTLLCQYMDSIVEEARATYENDLDSDPMVSHSLKIRVQQRKSVVQGIKDFVQETLDFRLSLLSDPQGEQNGDQPDAGYYPIGGVPKTASGNGSNTYPYSTANPPTDPSLLPSEPEWGNLQKQDDGTFSIKLKTGEEFKGKAEDILPILAKSKWDSSTYAKDLKTKLDAATPLQPRQSNSAKTLPPLPRMLRSKQPSPSTMRL
jgi:hypothetical protein